MVSGCKRSIATRCWPATKRAASGCRWSSRPPSPPAPSLDALDRAVLEVCGTWDSRPRAQAFRAMLDRPELQGEVERIHRVLGGAPAPLPRFKDELTSVWFAAGGFVHVFCGEPEPGKLGGLHYRGRYLELQEQGSADLASGAECPQAEIEPPVYTFGVRFRLPGGGAIQTDWRKATPTTSAPATF